MTLCLFNKPTSAMAKNNISLIAPLVDVSLEKCSKMYPEKCRLKYSYLFAILTMYNYGWLHYLYG